MEAVLTDNILDSQHFIKQLPKDAAIRNDFTKKKSKIIFIFVTKNNTMINNNCRVSDSSSDKAPRQWKWTAAGTL